MLDIHWDHLSRQRECAKFGHYHEAETVLSEVAAGQSRHLLAHPLRVGTVTFSHRDREDTQMPLYVWRCESGHATMNYPNGMPGHNMRIQCHCGNAHYFSRLRYRIGELPAFVRLLFRLRFGRRTSSSAH